MHVTVTWNDNPTTAALRAQLPLTLTFTDYGGQEKLAPLPQALPTDGAPAQGHGAPGTIAYYAPNQSLVLYYSDAGRWGGIVPLGTIDIDLGELEALPDGTPLTIR